MGGMHFQAGTDHKVIIFPGLKYYYLGTLPPEIYHGISLQKTQFHLLVPIPNNTPGYAQVFR
jgi:hypothetical protein